MAPPNDIAFSGERSEAAATRGSAACQGWEDADVAVEVDAKRLLETSSGAGPDREKA